MGQADAQQQMATELRPWLAFLRTHAAITREMDAELAQQHGLTLSDYEVLLFLRSSDEGRLRMSQLADCVLLSRSGMTRLIKGLEQSGYVVRRPCPSDARVSYAQITDAGIDKLRAARETHMESVHRLFLDRFDEHDREQLAELLERLPMSFGDCRRCRDGGE